MLNGQGLLMAASVMELERRAACCHGSTGRPPRVDMSSAQSGAKRALFSGRGLRRSHRRSLQCQTQQRQAALHAQAMLCVVRWHAANAGLSPQSSQAAP